MQSIIRFVLKSRLLIISLALLIMGLGYVSYNNLTLDAFPDVSPSLVQVFTVTEGLAPEEVEKYVTYPIEIAMNGLPGIEKIRSVSNFGISVVNIYFKDGTDIYFARQLVNERLQEAREQIPEGFGSPELGPISTAMGLVLFYFLEDETGNYSLEELRSIHDWVVKVHLQTVPGVTEVLGIGGFEKQYHIVIRPEALLSFEVSLNDVMEKIKSNNLNVGAQFIEQNAEEYIVRSVGLASSIKDLEDIVIKTEDGTPVYLKQLADIRIGGAVRRGVQTYNGKKEVVAGMVVKLYGANSSTVIEEVEKKISTINNSLPKGLKLVPYYEQKTLVEACVATVTNALMEGGIFVIFILLLFMGSLSAGIVVALTVPFSMLFAVIGMKYFGISANLMSFGGLAIAIGMMVDGTIVIVENVDTHLKIPSQEPYLKIITRACLEVSRPIIFAIAIIIIVFIPLIALKGVEGKTFRPLAYTVSLGMLGSLIYAIFLAPVLSTLLMKRTETKKTRKSIDEWIFGFLLMLYKPCLSFLVKNRAFVIFLAIAILAIGIIIAPQLGSEFTPQLQEGSLVIRLSMAPSISLNESKRLTMIVERRLLKIKEITQVVTRIGRGEVGAHTDPINSAEMFVALKPQAEWRVGKQQELEKLIREELGEIPGIIPNFTQPIAMSVDELLEGVRAQLAIKLFGEDIGLLKETADKIAEVVKKVRGAADVQADQVSGIPQLLIRIDRKKMARYGVNVSDAQGVLKAAVGGETVGQIFEGVRRFDILVRFPIAYRNTPEAISQILIPTPSNGHIPLSEIAEISEIVGPRQITRENSQRFITVQCNVVGRDIGTFVEEAQRKIGEQVKFPSGYLLTWGGQYTLQQEANKRLALVIPLTTLIVFLLMYSSFNSLRSSLLIFTNIPLALVGGLVGLWLTGQNLSVPASVGFIALFGIALEDAMVLVACLNDLARQRLPIDELSIKGGCMRIRAVLITTITTLIGLVPLLFSTGTGSEVQRPLATVVVAGLATSTMVTLFFVPVLYKWFIIEEETTSKRK